jgi:hypothetical protein
VTPRVAFILLIVGYAVVGAFLCPVAVQAVTR